MSSRKWILCLILSFLLPIVFSKECVYNLKNLTLPTLFSVNNTTLPTSGYVMFIKTPTLNQSCVLSLRKLPQNLFQDGISVYYFVCTEMFPVMLDTEEIPPTNSTILYLQVRKCLLGFSEIQKLEEIYNLKVLTYINVMPTEESWQIQNESQILDGVVAYSIYSKTFSENQPWIFTANQTFPSLIEIFLGGIGLQDLPPDMALRFPNLQSIELGNNLLTNVPKLEFGESLIPLPLGLTRTPEMQYEYADAIGIKVKPNFFRKILILDGNLISSLEDFIFNGTLHKISVAKNSLTYISPRTFTNVLGLISVNLSYNLLSSLPEQTFQNCTDLLYLTLSHNNFSEIPAGVFKNNQKLLRLDLSKNNLIHIQPGTFDNLKSLTYLDLSHNSIVQFQKHVLPKDFGSLETLKLSNNNLTNLPIEFFMPNRMVLIDLQDCQITIDNLTDILDSINDTKIADVHSSRILEIGNHKTEINLSNNLINQLNFGNFKEQHAQKMLSLFNNFHLNLSRNPIECDCHIFPLLDFFQKAKENKIYSGKEYFYQNWKCQYPTEFQHLPMLSLTKEDLYCQETMANCPRECFCYKRPIKKMVIIDCRHQQLTSLPNKMPPGNLEIWLQYNNITKLDERNYLQRIEILNMNHNPISDLDLVENLNNLKEAFFHSNALISVPPTFQKLPLRSLNISWNHFKCDCHSLWLKNWLLNVQDKVKGWSDFKCRIYTGNIKAVINIPNSDFKCFQNERFLIRNTEITAISIFVVAILACILIFIKLKRGIIC